MTGFQSRAGKAKREMSPRTLQSCKKKANPLSRDRTAGLKMRRLLPLQSCALPAELRRDEILRISVTVCAIYTA